MGRNQSEEEVDRNREGQGQRPWGRNVPVAHEEPSTVGKGRGAGAEFTHTDGAGA